MLQITAELETLSQAQRESLSSFILSYPTPPSPPQVTDNTDDTDDLAVIQAFTPYVDDPDAEAAAVFGAPLPEDVFCNKLTEKTDQFVASPAAVVVAGPVLVPTPLNPIVADAGADRLDKSGLPWDERIHAGTRARTADGCWRKKRGVEDATVAHVESELKALMGIPAPSSIPDPTTSIFPPAAFLPPPPASQAGDRQAYVDLIAKASAAIGAKKLTTDQLAAAVIAAGVPSLPLLANRLDLVPQVMAAVEAIIG